MCSYSRALQHGCGLHGKFASRENLLGSTSLSISSSFCETRPSVLIQSHSTYAVLNSMAAWLLGSRSTVLGCSAT
jgi:hypothetical protein